MRLIISIFAFVLSASLVKGQNSYYCDPALCDGFSNSHIGCPGVLNSNCPSDARVVNMAPYQSYILRFINSGRNRLAAGQLGLPRATRLTEVQWDNELAYLATLNVRQCYFSHDQCHNTYEYPFSGQNIAWTWGYPSDNASITWTLNAWWDEYQDTTAQDIADYDPSWAVIGHFTVMANQRTLFIGCGAITYANGRERLFTCNFSYTNWYNAPVYQTGSTGSQCTRGRSPTYPNLCRIGEPINYQVWPYSASINTQPRIANNSDVRPVVRRYDE